MLQPCVFNVIICEPVGTTDTAMTEAQFLALMIGLASSGVKGQPQGQGTLEDMEKFRAAMPFHPILSPGHDNETCDAWVRIRPKQVAYCRSAVRGMPDADRNAQNMVDGISGPLQDHKSKKHLSC